MNLHDVRFSLTNVAIWLSVYGGNGRHIGNHLWVIPEGEPPTDPEFRANYQSTRYWTPRRLGWRAFSYATLFRHGYVPPICGHRSASRHPRVYTADGMGGCSDCRSIAALSGIVPLTYTQAQEQSSIQQALAAETLAWQEAGRPTPWPPLPSDDPST